MVKLTESIVCSRTKASSLDSVRKLNCWGCDLDDIEILQQMPNVEVLSLSVNNIETIWPLAGCINLRELYLRKNNITELRELRHLRRLSKLRILWLSENPLAEHPDYRYYVLKLLPTLTTLDNRPVTAEELNAVAAYDQQTNGGMNEDGSVQQAEESCAYSSPECDFPSPEMNGVNNGVGWKTVRLPDRQPAMARRVVDADRPQMTLENFTGMSTSCYVTGVAAESNGYHVPRNDRRNTSTSMTSLYDTVPEMTTWQQQHQRNAMQRSTSNVNQNILTAISALLNELDRQGLEMVINEAEQRMRRL